MPEFLTTIIASFDADDEVSARVISEVIVENAQKDLEETDEVWVAQVLGVGGTSTPHTVIQRIKAVRNDLIRLRKNDCFDIARELDKIAWMLSIGEGSVTHTSYSYGDFLDTAQKVLDGKEII